MGGMVKQRGIMLYGAIAALLVIGGMSIALKIAVARGDKWKNAHDTFVAQTESAGKARIERLKAERISRAAITKQTESEHAKRTQSLNAQLAAAIAAARVRQPDSGGGGVQPLSAAASSIGCPDRQADIAGRLERFEIGILERIVGRGNAAIERSMFCKEWIDRQTAIQQ